MIQRWGISGLALNLQHSAVGPGLLEPIFVANANVQPGDAGEPGAGSA
jgi:hypothetical protein